LDRVAYLGLMRTTKKWLAFGLLVLGLTTGCSKAEDPECEITCTDGFKTTQDGTCADATVAIAVLANRHGGSCTGKDQH